MNLQVYPPVDIHPAVYRAQQARAMAQVLPALDVPFSKIASPQGGQRPWRDTDELNLLTIDGQKFAILASLAMTVCALGAIWLYQPPV